eukprot:scaffold7603_cov71-Cylindrotheca_fusiformis.AAC.3
MDDRIANPSSEFGLSSITGFWFGFVASNSKILQRDDDVDDWNHKQSEERFQVIEPLPSMVPLLGMRLKHLFPGMCPPCQLKMVGIQEELVARKMNGMEKAQCGKWKKASRPLTKQIEGKSHPTVTISLTKVLNEGWLSSFFLLKMTKSKLTELLYTWMENRIQRKIETFYYCKGESVNFLIPS